jgi:NADP-dependent 3-hydroxy acid dehydrogenase YdfG
MVTGDAQSTAQKPDNRDGSHRPLRGKSALVTGGGSGIGRAIAIALGALGATVLVAGRRPERLDQTVSAIHDAGGRGLRYVLDVTDDAAVTALGHFVDERTEGALSVLVHSAGLSTLSTTDDTTVEQLDAIFDTNMRAPFVITRCLLPLIRRASGDIVFVNSNATVNPRAEAGVYAASKAALRAFADSLRAEVNEDGVRVLSIFPGRTATPMQAAVFVQEGRASDYKPELLIQPENVAAATLGAILLPRTAELTELFIRPANKV